MPIPSSSAACFLTFIAQRVSASRIICFISSAPYPLFFFRNAGWRRPAAFALFDFTAADKIWRQQLYQINHLAGGTVNQILHQLLSSRILPGQRRFFSKAMTSGTRRDRPAPADGCADAGNSESAVRYHLTLAQRRQAQWDDIKPIEQIFAEFPLRQ